MPGTRKGGKGGKIWQVRKQDNVKPLEHQVSRGKEE